MAANSISDAISTLHTRARHGVRSVVQNRPEIDRQPASCPVRCGWERLVHIGRIRTSAAENVLIWRGSPATGQGSTTLCLRRLPVRTCRLVSGFVIAATLLAPQFASAATVAPLAAPGDSQGQKVTMTRPMTRSIGTKPTPRRGDCSRLSTELSRLSPSTKT